MARIRTIKPEFSQAENIGRVSREARLLFLLVMPHCDDAGRSRAAPHMLAGLLFPFDADARDLVDGWLDELERENCIRRYEVGGNRFLEIPDWSTYQRIDKPSAPVFPLPSWGSREDSSTPRDDWSSAREGSALERNGKEGNGGDKTNASRNRVRSAKYRLPPDFAISDRVRAWAADKGFDRIDEHFEAFVITARKQGYAYSDWDAAFMEAVRMDWARLRVPSSEPPVRERVDL